MKGVILTSFVSWVEATRGVVTADRVIQAAAPALSTGGAYTSVGNYPATEFTALLESLASIEGQSSDAILHEFGVAAFPVLASLHPEWLDGMEDLDSMLSQIESIIHTEVRKLYPDAQPPLITARRNDDGVLEVTYESHRDLVPMCQGLVEGAARHFGSTGGVRIISTERVDERTRAVMIVEESDHG